MARARRSPDRLPAAGEPGEPVVVVPVAPGAVELLEEAEDDRVAGEDLPVRPPEDDDVDPQSALRRSAVRSEPEPPADGPGAGVGALAPPGVVRVASERASLTPAVASAPTRDERDAGDVDADRHDPTLSAPSHEAASASVHEPDEPRLGAVAGSERAPSGGVRGGEWEMDFRAPPSVDTEHSTPALPGAELAAGALGRRGRRRMASAREAQEHELDERLIAVAARESNVIAVGSPKGGVGKTTLALCLADVLAHGCPHLRVAVVDCDPDFGSLAALAPAGPQRGLALDDLLLDEDPDLDRYATELPSGCHLFAAPSSGRANQVLLEEAVNFRTLIDVLRPAYHVIVLDLGAGVLNPIAQTVIAHADQALLVAEPDPISASRLLDALEHLERDRAFMHPDRPGQPTRITVALNKHSEARHHDAEPILSEFHRRGLEPLAIPECGELREMLGWGTYDLSALPAAMRGALKRLALTLADGLR